MTNYFDMFKNKLADVQHWVQEMEDLEKRGDDGSSDALNCGLGLLNAQCELISFMFTNTNEAYRNHLTAANKFTPRLMSDDNGINHDPDLYEGKFFYEIVKDESGSITSMINVTDTLRYIAQEFKLSIVDEKFDSRKKYKFVQVIDGKPVVAFEEHEILVTDREL